MKDIFVIEVFINAINPPTFQSDPLKFQEYLDYLIFLLEFEI